MLVEESPWSSLGCSEGCVVVYVDVLEACIDGPGTAAVVVLLGVVSFADPLGDNGVGLRITVVVISPGRPAVGACMRIIL